MNKDDRSVKQVTETASDVTIVFSKDGGASASNNDIPPPKSGASASPSGTSPGGMNKEPETLRTGTFYRSVDFDRSMVDEENRSVSVAFSSELPVERYFGNEVLSHEPEHVRMNRLLDGGAVLVDHDPTDVVGVVEHANIDGDRKGRAVVRFGRSERAEEVWNDVLDGIRRHISVGYVIHEMRQDEGERNSGEVDVFRAVDWEPHEVSWVSIPADPTVGVARNESDSDQPILTRVFRAPTPRVVGDALNMTEGKETRDEVAKEITADVHRSEKVSTAKVVEDARRGELERINELEQLGTQHANQELARKFISEGRSVDEFKGALLESIAKPIANGSSDVGMSEKEASQFSFRRAVHALANPHDRRAQEDAAYEFECSRAACDKGGTDTRGIRVPSDVLKREVTYGGTGDSFVSTDLMGFADMLRASSWALQNGTTLSGLVGNVAIPRQTSASTAYWLAESAAVTESTPAFDQVTMSPKTVGAYVDISRKLVQQSSLDVEALIRQDMATVLGLAMDGVAIEGGGSNEPTGITQTTGIGSVSYGDNGGAPAWEHIVGLETAVSQDNALNGSLGYLSNYKVAGKLKQVEKAENTAAFILDGGSTNGYPFHVSNQVPSDLTKGTSSNCSAIIFGNFSDLLIGMWGGLDLTVDPYSESTKGTVRLVAFQDCDIAVRHAESFSAMLDAITT